MIIGLDKWYYPVEIPSGAQIRIGSTTVALTPGIYWAHASSFFPTGFLSFYAHLITQLTVAFGGTWTVEPYRPSGYALTSGVRLKVTGITPGSLVLASTTAVVRRLLGFDAADVSTVSFVSGRIEGPYAAYGAWCPWSCFDGRATFKDSQRSRLIASSSDSQEDAVRTIWRDRKVRSLLYEYVWGPYVYGTRADVQALATQAGVALGDDNNALVNLWEALSNTGAQLLVVYDLTDLDLTIPTNGYETGRLATARAYTDLEDLATRNQLASDLWTVRVPFLAQGGSYGL